MTENDALQPISYPVALAAAAGLKAELEATKIIRHPGEVGRSRENLLREFLASFCGQDFQFDTGFVFDAHGRMSRQQDIVIYRNSYHPIFKVGRINHFPIESVAAVIEVKSTLGSRNAMNDAMDNIASVKALDRTGKGKNYVVARGRPEVLDPNQHEHQVFSAIAMLGGMGGAAAVSTVADWCESHERSQWPNGIVSAFEYSIFYILRVNCRAVIIWSHSESAQLSHLILRILQFRFLISSDS